jgi:hypothetical protein
MWLLVSLAPLVLGAAVEQPPSSGAARLASSEELRPWLPEPIWPHRELFFPVDRPLELAEKGNYAPPEAWHAATREYAEGVALGPEGHLKGYVAGTPFAMDGIDCATDPDAGVKLAWNFAHRWRGDGGRGSLRVSWWDRGERVGPALEASWSLVRLSHRVEPELLAAQGGRLFRGERRMEALAIDIEAPFEARGTWIIRYRYAPDLDRPDDLWVYVPTLRRVRRIQAERWTEAIPGTDLVLEDWGALGSRVQAHRFLCLEERTLLAPVRSRVGEPPGLDDPRFGSSGLALPDAVFELRRAVRVRATPRDPDHPYAHKDLWLDRETFEPLYFLAYDRAGELLRIGVQTSRWSGDVPGTYAGWSGVPEPRDLFGVAWSVANVQLGTGVRWEAWDATGTPFESRGKLRRAIDLNRGCVAAGTIIATEDGPLPVETLRIGDRVFGFDPGARRRVLTTVTAVVRTTATSTLILGSGLRATPDHPVFADGTFRPAGELVPGSMLLAENGAIVPVLSVAHVPGEVTVYDLSVGWPHTYFAAGILVHNKGR